MLVPLPHPTFLSSSFFLLFCHGVPNEILPGRQQNNCNNNSARINKDERWKRKETERTWQLIDQGEKVEDRNAGDGMRHGGENGPHVLHPFRVGSREKEERERK